MIRYLQCLKTMPTEASTYCTNRRTLVYIPIEWRNQFREDWWLVHQLNELGHPYFYAPSSLEAVDSLENPPRDPSATTDIEEIPPSDSSAPTSKVSSDSLSERSPPSPGLIKSLINCLMRRKRTITVFEGAPPPYVDDRKNYAARV